MSDLHVSIFKLRGHAICLSSTSSWPRLQDVGLQGRGPIGKGHGLHLMGLYLLLGTGGDIGPAVSELQWLYSLRASLDKPTLGKESHIR